MPIQWTEATHKVAGTNMHVREAGSGVPVVVLHHDIGTPARLPFYDALAAQHRVILPIHPGWGMKSERPEWMRSVRDIAAMYRMHLAQQGVAKAHLVGLGFGGWIAAEMATMAPTDTGRLVLAGAMGVQPKQGYIMDMAIHGYLDYARAFFHDPQKFGAVWGEPDGDMLENFDICREMCFRVAWKPYMFRHTLPNLLQSVPNRALVVWGDDDKVVPAECADLYCAALPNARKEIVKGCGHAIDMEKPDQLAGLIAGFLKA
jgi:pimeloyl-ACP methyl ester carboxylesterase